MTSERTNGQADRRTWRVNERCDWDRSPTSGRFSGRSRRTRLPFRRYYYRQDAAKQQTAGIKFTQAKNQFFSPRRADSLHRFRSNLAGLTGTWVRLAVQNFTLIGAGGGNAAPKYQKFPLFGKESPHRGEPLDQFLNFFRGFYTANYPTLAFQI